MVRNRENHHLLIIGTGVVLIALVCYAFFLFQTREVSQELVRNWLQAEAVNIQQGNLLSSVTKNHRVLMQSDFITGISVLHKDRNGPPLLQLGQISRHRNLKHLSPGEIETYLVDPISIGVAHRFSHDPGLQIQFLVRSKTLFWAIIILIGLFAFLFGSFLWIMRTLNQREMRAREELATHKETVARQVSHDIRTPLSALKVLTEPSIQLPAPQRKLLLSAIERIDRIANDLLQNTRASTDVLIPKLNLQHSTDLTLAQVHSLIRSSVNELLVARPEVQCRIQFDWNPNDETKVQIGGARLDRAVTNLVKNAIEASGDRPQIHVSTQIVDNSVEIRIQDHGCGMSQDLLQRALAGGYSSKAKGHGLGLSGSRRMIEEAGGRFEITSSPGTGTEILLVLPILCRAFDRAFESPL